MPALAETLALDPIELRLRNDTQIEPEQHKPFSSRHLAEALREGAARFGTRITPSWLHANEESE